MTWLSNLRKHRTKNATSARPGSLDVTPEAPRSSEGSFEATCTICGRTGAFELGNGYYGYACSMCRGTLRYQGQADALVRSYGTQGARSLAELVREPAFNALRVYEPGDRGPLYRYLRELPGHLRSSFLPGVEGGTVVDDVRCEDLMALTFPSDEFDLVITSDVMEHVRRPYTAFAEIHRVLRRGGRHVFTVPAKHPLRDQTVVRVDTSGPEDVFLLDPTYHNEHLVYNDFGADMLDRLADIGFDTEAVRFASPDPNAWKQLTFSSLKR